MTSPAGNNVRHIDVSDVISADFQLPDGHAPPAEGHVKVVVGNGSVRQRESRRPRPHVDEVIGEVADCPRDDVVHAADVTDVMRCDGRGCGRLDDGYSGCDDHGKASTAVNSQHFVLLCDPSFSRPH